MPLIRPSHDDDLAAITAIYAHHVLHGTGTFETEPPTEADMATRRADVLGKGLPYLVAELLRGRTLRYDAWLVEPLEDNSVSLRGHLDPDSFIEIPASGPGVISVGALRSRLDWRRADGKQESISREIGRTAPFSA